MVTTSYWPPRIAASVHGLLAKDISFQHHPVELNLRVLSFEFVGQELHDDHVAVVDGGNGQGSPRVKEG